MVHFKVPCDWLEKKNKNAASKCYSEGCKKNHGCRGLLRRVVTVAEMSHCGSYMQTVIFASFMKIRFLCSFDLNYLLVGHFCSTVSMVNMNRLRTIVVIVKDLCITMVSPPCTSWRFHEQGRIWKRAEYSKLSNV